MRRKITVVRRASATGAIVVACVVAVLGCKPSPGGSGDPKQAAKPPALVKVATARIQSVPILLNGIGTVVPITTIQVRAQVGGELTEVHFTEGDLVEKDQILFSIDPRPYQVALAQAEANLAKMIAMADQARAQWARDKAQAENAQAEFERNKPLLPKGMVSKEEFDKVRAAAEASKAVVAASEAAIKSAEESVRAAKVAIEDATLKLGYCTIRSPIGGRTGSLLIHAGNLVKANDAAPMVVVNQIAPIHVSFTLPERHLGAVRAAMAQGPLDVTARPQGGEGSVAEGSLTFVDNEVDQSTGTIRFKAVFPNEDGLLWPGQFVRVFLRVGAREKAVVVPSRAVQTGQQGTYVYVLKDHKTIELRPVTTGESYEDVTIITEGVAEKETVVTDGHLKLVPGATAVVADEKPPAGEKR
ncbi:MAG TPA: efflux RND transporter periplasmic adaptor subunit [Candidatus Hydrogenedentes bacterium]|nr:efflux RND transporter periplasmic adaptor subunit [Candidatus Hydrogenedentota bacterium]